MTQASNPQPLEDGELRDGIEHLLAPNADDETPDGVVRNYRTTVLHDTELDERIDRLMQLFKAELERRESEAYRFGRFSVIDELRFNAYYRSGPDTCEALEEAASDLFEKPIDDMWGDYTEMQDRVRKFKAQLTPTPESKQNEETE